MQFTNKPRIRAPAMRDNDIMMENFERPEKPRHYHSQHHFGQPRFKGPTRLAPPRDRYRATQYDNLMYDLVEDDECFQNEHLDSFDRKLLQQPYEGRHRQSMADRVRISLVPGPSRFRSGATLPQSQFQDQSDCHHAHTDRDSKNLRDCSFSEHRGNSNVTIRNQAHSEHEIEQFEDDCNQRDMLSSDFQVNPSSPTLRASQRRKEQASSNMYTSVPDSMTSERKQQHLSEYQKGRHLDATQDVEFAYTCLETNKPREVKASSQQSQEVAGFQELYIPKSQNQPQNQHVNTAHTPLVQGIRLVPVMTLPDRLRAIFPFPAFNGIQSKCFDKVFKTENNFVLASPTGSGKTAVLELAICRAVVTNATDEYKVVYQAPTKALCAERQRDWGVKFHQLGLKCAELTGDSDAADLRNVQSASIIITTPEKWDSITRKWKDHEKLMRLVKLFLIDEVHILKENRGAVLETVVSRMKSIGVDVRFLALSATVPNIHDVASWLGKNTLNPQQPAEIEEFGEEFRPVKLKKHVCGYASNNNNEFAFDKILDTKLPDVIAKYSESKPIMIFCATRNSTVHTAKLIAKWWMSTLPHNRIWSSPIKIPPVLDKDLRDTIVSGVAFHNAGLNLDDRIQVETGFLKGDISVICCTSTLAVGVNLPCHLVIVKNTVTFTAEGLQEYSDLELMQMLGRAGRPQFDTSAVAVILTRQSKIRRYEAMVTGKELLESRLHLNLIDHMNAEISLGTIRDLRSARNWLTGTFFFVRLQKNPNHYKLDGAINGQTIESQVDEICFRDITLLLQSNLVSGQERFKSTEFGLAMARYYIHFETMKVFMGLHSKSSPSEILSALAQASEFSMIRFRQGERAFYRILNKSPSIRWSIPVNLDLPAQKVSLIVQSVLGSADICWDSETGKHKSQYITETQIVFKGINALVRCIIDCQIFQGDSIGIHSALMLERSLGSRAWDDSPLQMKQIEGIGVVAVRKFANAGIRSIEDLESCDPSRIEALIGRNPPFGLKVLEKVRMFPKLRVSLHVPQSTISKSPEGVIVQVKADIGFINENPPQRFANRLIYVCLLAETSDGRKLHFARTSGSTLSHGQSLTFSALLTHSDQSINCYVMCDSIAGSMRSASMKPPVTSSMFPAPKKLNFEHSIQPNVSRRRIESLKSTTMLSATNDDFDDDGISDEELMKASYGGLEFDQIENYTDTTELIAQKKNTKVNPPKARRTAQRGREPVEDDMENPVKLANGKWACNHRCKDRNGCRHLCCKEGIDKPPKKKPSVKRTTDDDHQTHLQQSAPNKKIKGTQTKLRLNSFKPKSPLEIEELDLTFQTNQSKFEKDYGELDQVTRQPCSLLPNHAKNRQYSRDYSQNQFEVDQFHYKYDKASESNDDVCIDAPSPHLNQSNALSQNLDTLNGTLKSGECSGFSIYQPFVSSGSDMFEDNDSLLADAMIGLTDSHNLQMESKPHNHSGTSGRLANQYRTNNAVDSIEEDTTLEIDIAPHEDGIANLDPDLSEVHPTSINQTQSPKPHLSVSRMDISHDNDLSYNIEASKMCEIKNTSKRHPESMMLASSREANATGTMSENMPGSESFKDLEPWLFQEFGDIVELIDE